jgi:hypothetical protein
MTHENAFSDLNNIDELPQPAAASVRDSSASVLPRPVSLQPDIADNGRISFGAGFRLLRK